MSYAWTNGPWTGKISSSLWAVRPKSKQLSLNSTNDCQQNKMGKYLNLFKCVNRILYNNGDLVPEFCKLEGHRALGHLASDEGQVLQTVRTCFVLKWRKNEKAPEQLSCGTNYIPETETVFDHSQKLCLRLWGLWFQQVYWRIQKFRLSLVE